MQKAAIEPMPMELYLQAVRAQAVEEYLRVFNLGDIVAHRRRRPENLVLVDRNVEELAALTAEEMSVRLRRRVELDSLLVYAEDFDKAGLGEKLGRAVKRRDGHRRLLRRKLPVKRLGRRMVLASFELLKDGDALGRYLRASLPKYRYPVIYSPHR